MEIERPLKKGSSRYIHIMFDNIQQLNEEQLRRFCKILEMEQLGLVTGGMGLGCAYLDFCFNNKLSDDEIQMKIFALHNSIKKTVNRLCRKSN